MASMRLSFLSFFGNNQNDSTLVSSSLFGQGQQQQQSLADGRSAMSATSPLSATTSSSAPISTLSREPSLVSWLLSNTPSKHQHEQQQGGAAIPHQDGTATLLASNPFSTGKLSTLLPNSTSNTGLNVSDGSHSTSKNSHQNKNIPKNQRQQHPLSSLSSDLHLLFPTVGSFERFLQTIQLLKDDYLQAINTSRSALHQHLAHARQRETEAAERARRLRAKEEVEAQRAFGVVVLDAREQLDGLVLEAIKRVLYPQLQQEDWPDQAQDGRSSRVDEKKSDGRGRDNALDVPSSMEQCQQQLPKCGQYETKERGRMLKEEDQEQRALTPHLQQQQQQQAPRTPVRFGWRFIMKHNTKHRVEENENPTPLAPMLPHRQDQERREGLKARLRQLVALEERKLQERLAAARSSQRFAEK